MRLQSNRLIVSEVTLEDLEEIHELHSIPEVDEYNTLGIPESIDQTKAMILPLIKEQILESRKSYFWKILLADANTFIGIAGLNLSADKFKLGEIYYKLLPAYWGNGYATEIAKRLIVFGFEELGLHKLEAGVATGNQASIRVLEKSGMIREGLRRKILPIRGEWKDNYHYAIVEDDPRDY